MAIDYSNGFSTTLRKKIMKLPTSAKLAICIGSLVVVLLNTSLDILPKGENRPLDPEIARAMVIEHLNAVARERNRLERQ